LVRHTLLDTASHHHTVRHAVLETASHSMELNLIRNHINQQKRSIFDVYL